MKKASVKPWRFKGELLSKGEANYKLAKNATRSVYLALAPARSAGVGKSVCPDAGVCARACVAYAGRGSFRNVQQARVRKTRAFWANRAGFLAQLSSELDRFNESGGGLCRLNTYSDLPFERWLPLETFQNVEFYDYTKSAGRAIRAARGGPLFLTYSVSERTAPGVAWSILKAGGSVAVVTTAKRGEPLPDTWIIDGERFPALDGDLDDERTRAKGAGKVVLLRWKGSGKDCAKAEAQGFAIPVQGLTISGKVGMYV